MHRALHKPRSGGLTVLLDGRPGRRHDRSAVAVAGRAHLLRVAQLPILTGWPPRASAVSAAEFLPAGPAVFTAEAAPEPPPPVVGPGGGDRPRTPLVEGVLQPPPRPHP